MNIIDFTIYRATKVRVEYPTSLGQALHDLDKANRAVEETLGIFRDRDKLRAEQKWKPKLRDVFKPWWEGSWQE